MTANKKKYLVILALCVVIIPATFAQVFFDSEGGMALDVIPKVDFKGVELQTRAFYGAQMQLGNDILIESEFSFLTENIFGNIFMQDIPSNFSLDKLSFSYNVAGLDFNSRFTAFAGTHDGIGTDQFAQKYFGARAFDSTLFEQQISLPKASIFSINGFGIEANTVFGSSTATAFYAYYNEKYGFKQLNFDLRFVGIGNAIIADIAFGTSLPFDSTDSNGEDVILIIRRADLHTGLSMLIGNNPHANFLVQAGVTRIQIKPDPGNSIVSYQDIYALIEPRFTIENVNLNFSFFMLPDEVIETIPYIEHTLGTGIYFNAAQNFNGTKGNVGAHLTATYQDLLGDLSFDLSRLSVLVTPHFNLEFANSNLAISTPLNILKYKNPEEMIDISISYKTSF